jgi:hypothetical protein
MIIFHWQSKFRIKPKVDGVNFLNFKIEFLWFEFWLLYNSEVANSFIDKWNKNGE